MSFVQLFAKIPWKNVIGYAPEIVGVAQKIYEDVRKTGSATWRARWGSCPLHWASSPGASPWPLTPLEFFAKVST